MENNNTAQKGMDTQKTKIGNITYIVKSNAKSVPDDFVEKVVLRMLFNELKQKS